MYYIFLINFVPEFLREKCAIEDFIYNNQVLVIGTEDDEAGNHLTLSKTPI